jgi:hypothetical protein
VPSLAVTCCDCETSRGTIFAEELADPCFVTGPDIDRSQDSFLVNDPDGGERIDTQRARNGSAPAKAVEMCRPIGAEFSETALKGYTVLVEAYGDDPEVILGKRFP